jgi:alpha/beta superfamily hydrolase
MHNNVVVGIAFWFQKLGITTMRFDFGGSQIGRGYQQVQQVEEAANFLLKGGHQANKESPRPTYILLVGYSYGSIISASASANISQCVGVISIAPPLAVRHWLYVFNGNYHLGQAQKKPKLPKLMVIGSADNFTSEKVFMETVKSYPKQSTTGAILKDADHFFQGRVKDVVDIIGHWLLNTFSQCNGDLKRLSRANFEIDEVNAVGTESIQSGNLGIACNVFSSSG